MKKLFSLCLLFCLLNATAWSSENLKTMPVGLTIEEIEKINKGPFDVTYCGGNQPLEGWIDGYGVFQIQPAPKNLPASCLTYKSSDKRVAKSSARIVDYKTYEYCCD